MLEKALIQADQKQTHRTVSLSIGSKNVPAFFKAFNIYGTGIDILKVSQSYNLSFNAGYYIRFTLAYEFDWELFQLGQIFGAYTLTNT